MARQRGARVARVVGSGLRAVVLAALLVRPALADVLRPEDAGQHLGEEVTVEGRVANVVCSPLACLLSFSTDFSGLVASVAGEDVPRFPAPKETYTDRQVRVRGTIVERNGRLRMELASPEQITLVEPSGGATTVAPPPSASEAGGGRARQDSDAASAPATRSRVISPGQIVSRPGLPGERAERRAADAASPSLGVRSDDPVDFELRALRQQIARLEETTQVLSETVAALQERLIVLEQGGGGVRGGVDPSLLPEIRPYVVTGDRSQRVQHVKKGWTSERVMRALGAPVNTVTEPNGYMTWYYPYGRAITLDSRGRVTSSVGF